MKSSEDTFDLFDRWAVKNRGEDMARAHWPRVRQAFDLIPSGQGRYLEVGVGNGYSLSYMATHQFRGGRCLGLDLSREMTTLARINTEGIDNITILHGDFLKVDLAEYAPFSVIFSMEVFYYFTDIQAGINRAFSFMEPGGQLWVLVDYYRENTFSHGWPEELDTPMTLWSADEYRSSLDRAGFTGIQQMTFLDEAGRKRICLCGF